jgi:hypothetical protein
MTPQELRAKLDRIPDDILIDRIKNLLYANKRRCRCVGCGVGLWRNSKHDRAMCHDCTARKALTYYQIKTERNVA